MASPAAVLSILVKADGLVQTNRQLQGLHDDLGRSGKAGDRMGTDLDKGARRGSKALRALKSSAGVAVGALGAVGLAGAVNKAFDEFEEARKVGAQTNAVLKSTGGAAKISAKGVEDLAGSLSKKVGIDDEAIQKGANLLLTFKNIRNETGKGRDVFNQATAAAVDLSAAGFGSLESTSKQLGKALNDPVKGMTALGRSGVTFSEDQKKAIEALMSTGKAADRVKAQQLILKEVQSQVGGSAKAQASATDHLKVTLGNLAELAGSVLVPAFDKVARFLGTLIDQMIEGKGAGGAIVTVFATMGTTIGVLITAISSLVGWFRQHETVALALGAALAVIVTAFVGFKILAAVQAAIMAVRGAMLLLNASLFANPVGLVVLAIAALVAGLVIAYKQSETFRKIVNGAWAFLKTAAATIFPVIKAVIVGVWNAIKAATTAVWPVIKTIVVGVWSVLKTLVSTYFNAYKSIITGVWTVIKTVTTTAWGVIRDAIIEPIGRARERVLEIAGNLKDRIAEVWSKVKAGVNVLKDGFTGAFKKIGEAIDDVIGFFDSVIDRVKDLTGLLKPLKDAAGFLGSLPGKLPGIGGRGNGTTVGPLPSPSGSGVDMFNGIAARFGNSITSGYRPGDPGWHGQNRARDYAGGDMLGFAKAMLTFAPRLLELIHTPLGIGVKNGQIVPISFFGADVMADHYDHVHVAMRKGGRVPGSGSGDRVPAMLEPGEFVIRKRIVDRFGPTYFAGLNGMKKGGPAGEFTASQKAAEKARKRAEEKARKKFRNSMGSVGPNNSFGFTGSFGKTAPTPWWEKVVFPEVGPSPLDFINANIAKATLTPGLEDDLAAANERVGLAQGAFDTALLTADPRDDIAAANELKAARDAVAQLTEEMTRANALVQQRLALDTEIAANQVKILALAGQGDQIVGAVISAVNGGIGGPTGLGYSTPGYPGGGVRY